MLCFSCAVCVLQSKTQWMDLGCDLNGFPFGAISIGLLVESARALSPTTENLVIITDDHKWVDEHLRMWHIEHPDDPLKIHKLGTHNGNGKLHQNYCDHACPRFSADLTNRRFFMIGDSPFYEQFIKTGQLGRLLLSFGHLLI